MILVCKSTQIYLNMKRKGISIHRDKYSFSHIIKFYILNSNKSSKTKGNKFTVYFKFQISDF